MKERDEKMVMVKSRTIIKGVQSIRTLAGRADQSRQPYQAYLRIGALEMEKARRAKERESAMARVNNIDARFREIEAEKDALLKILAADDQRKLLSEQHGNHKRAAGSFKIRY